MKKLKLGFSCSFKTAEDFFAWALGKRFDVEVVPPGQCDYLIFGEGNTGTDHYQYRNCKRVLFTGENFRPNYFLHDHAISFDHENSPRHYRLPLYVVCLHQYWTHYYDTQMKDFDSFLGRLNSNRDDVPAGFASFVQSNPNHQIRNQFVQKLMETQKVDCGGPLFNNIGYVLPRDEDLKNKNTFASERKFNIAFENGIYPGYVTEKLLDAFMARTVPVYLGSMTVERDFNTERFINCHEYEHLGQVIDKMAGMSDEDWLKMVNQPVWKNNIPPATTNINNFLDWWETFVYE